MQMTDLERELQTLTPAETFRLYARRLQFWRLCAKAPCRRARDCRGNPRDCGTRLAEWADAVKETAQRERAARDPAVAALRAELAKQIEGLARTMGNEG